MRECPEEQYIFSFRDLIFWNSDEYINERIYLVETLEKVVYNI